MEQNVKEAIFSISSEIGRNAKMDFENEVIATIETYNIKSPIEQILFCALIATRELNYMRTLQQLSSGKLFGLAVIPQEHIGNYYIDFKVVFYDNINDVEKISTILVECDSQQFHERSEKERRYEKKRDRFLLENGYKIVHFTGAEIVSNPMDVAKEVISFVNKEGLI